MRIALKWGFDKERLAFMCVAGLLHDIGKIAVPRAILNKTTLLDEDEFEQLKAHSSVGARIVQGLRRLGSVYEVIEGHHERYDGRGYPHGLKGEEIPLESRIIAVADCYHAMASRRVYKAPHERHYIMDEFSRCRGTQFDPALSDTMVEMMKKGELEPIEKMCCAVF